MFKFLSMDDDTDNSNGAEAGAMTIVLLTFMLRQTKNDYCHHLIWNIYVHM